MDNDERSRMNNEAIDRADKRCNQRKPVVNVRNNWTHLVQTDHPHALLHQTINPLDTLLTRQERQNVNFIQMVEQFDFVPQDRQSAYYNQRIEQLMRTTGSLPVFDELEYRDCLVKSLTHKCKGITETTSIDGNELDILYSKYCITNEDKVNVMGNSRDGPLKRIRRLLSLIMFRDCRTILVFLECLMYQNMHVVAGILLEFDKLLTTFTKPPACTLCLLESRVEMSLIIDNLLSNNECWAMFFAKVSNRDSIGPDGKLWQELITMATRNGTLSQVRDIIIESLSSYGFHSDIVRLLNIEKRQQINSFVCRCGELDSKLRTTENGGLQGRPTNHDQQDGTKGMSLREEDLTPHFIEARGEICQSEYLGIMPECQPTDRLDNFNTNEKRNPFSSKSKKIGSMPSSQSRSARSTKDIHEMSDGQRQVGEVVGAKGGVAEQQKMLELKRVVNEQENDSETERKHELNYEESKISTGDDFGNNGRNEQHQMLALKAAHYENDDKDQTETKRTLKLENTALPSANDTCERKGNIEVRNIEMKELKGYLSENDAMSDFTEVSQYSIESRFYSTESSDTDMYKMPVAEIDTSVRYKGQYTATVSKTDMIDKSSEEHQTEILKVFYRGLPQFKDGSSEGHIGSESLEGSEKDSSLDEESDGDFSDTEEQTIPKQTLYNDLTERYDPMMPFRQRRLPLCDANIQPRQLSEDADTKAIDNVRSITETLCALFILVIFNVILVQWNLR